MGASMISQSEMTNNRFSNANPGGSFLFNTNATVTNLAQVQEKTTQAAVAFIIQSEREIAAWKKSTPMTLQDINSYVAVKFVSKLSGIPAGLN